jgi:amino acid adenylation domain-containing protein
MVTQRNVVNRLRWMWERYPFAATGETGCQKTSMNFIDSIAEMLGPLLQGISLVVLADEIVKDLDRLVVALEEHGITRVVLVPSLLRQLLRWAPNPGPRFRSLKHWTVSGEALDGEVVRSFGRQMGGRQMLNLYGSSEVMGDATCWEVEMERFAEPVLIGRAIANTAVYVVGEEWEMVPVGAVGELCIGGAGMARGYLNQAGWTAERFVPNPYSEEEGARMYRSGDLARWRGDGQLEFLGRKDHQVKVRGYRIELGEIEAVMREHGGVEQAVVVVGEEGGGEKRLVGYVMGKEGVSLEGVELKSHVRRKLPEYMVPSAVVVVEEFPLNANGKVDRGALARMEALGRGGGEREYEGPRTAVEEMLCGIWEEVLKVERVGIRDNFFDLGGHSLLALRVIARVRKALGVEVEIGYLFEQPVLSDFVRGVESARQTQLPAITRAERGERIPLSYAQQRLWFLAQMEGGSGAYHIPLRVRLRGRLDREALKLALDRIVERHEGLRTRFVSVEGEAEQRIGAVEESGFPLAEKEWGEQEDVQGELERVMAEEARAEFDLETGPLIRGQLIRLSEEEHVLLITMHHIVADGWSLGIFFKELNRLYGAYIKGEADGLAKLVLQYPDYAVWQRRWMEEKFLGQQAEYWRKNLAGAPELLEVPADRVRPERQDYAGAALSVVLEEKLTAGLKQLSRRHGTTLYMTLLAGWVVLMGRLSGQEDVVIGTPVANRGRVEIENLIGFFVNTLALRVDVSGSPTVAEVLGRVKSQVIAAQQHQDMPFEQVVELVQPVRSLAHSPVFQVMFAWQNAAEGKLELAGLEVQRLKSSSHQVSKFDMGLSLGPSGSFITGVVEYATALFEARTLERYWGYFQTLLEGMTSDDTLPVDRLTLLGEAERDRVLYRWNETKTEYGWEWYVHELFERQVERTPDAIAVVYADKQLTYGELNRRSNQVAHYLHAMGVRPDARVGISMNRSLEMLVGLLGVWKAGGAYVPLDPSYPLERLNYMLNHSAPAVLLTQGDLLGNFERLKESLQLINLTDAAPAWSIQPETNPDHAAIGVTSEHLAYMIYTSGSTGLSKGVMVRHQSVMNLFFALQQSVYSNHQTGCLRVSVNGSMSFDTSVKQIIQLAGGHTLDIVPEDLRRDGKALLQFVREREIEVLDCTPSQLHLLLEAGLTGERPDGQVGNAGNLKLVLVGGESIEKNMWEKLAGARISFFNVYGPTECTVDASVCAVSQGTEPSIGAPIANTALYVLDGDLNPLPTGVSGELYIGGDGVARGYWNDPGTTAQKFIPDPFSSAPGARLYRSGDRVRRLAHGDLAFSGRTDNQVKIRGYRIELGEIEAHLAGHPSLNEAVVLVREDVPGEKRLVAYYTVRMNGSQGERNGGATKEVGGEELRLYLGGKLPEYMVPTIYVRLDHLPLTVNGKLDRRALPEPEPDAYALSRYEAPIGKIETEIAATWVEVLKVERVGRHDNFFALGGHSLLAVKLIEKMKQKGMYLGVASVFATPTVAGLAVAVGPQPEIVRVPPNLIPNNCQVITPEMLPLIELSTGEIERIVSSVKGGAGNIQDIYPLAPLQEGIFFHHVMNPEGDPYLGWLELSFDSRDRLEMYLAALQNVIDRHDILRTAVLWEELSEPVQVVWRKAVLQVEEVAVEEGKGEIAEQLYERFNPRRYRIDVREAPMLRAYIAYDRSQQQWVMVQLQHHLAGDHSTQDVIEEEMRAFLRGDAERLPAPKPFRSLVAQARLGIKLEEHEAFFRRMLSDVDEGTVPFGLREVQGDGTGIEEEGMMLDPDLVRRVRNCARKLKVSVATLCHLAWARVLGMASGQQDVVFGTVLLGRMWGVDGGERGVGMYINTLPVRIGVREEGVEWHVGHVQRLLTDLMRHEHASLSLAQRCSGVKAPAPLFSALLNYRHNVRRQRSRADEEAMACAGIKRLRGEQRSNYPIVMSVEDWGEELGLRAQAPGWIGPMRVCEYMLTALASLVEALEKMPGKAVKDLEVLPDAERRQVLYEWNQTEVWVRSGCVHELFEEQVRRMPDAVALLLDGAVVSYAKLNAKANGVGHYLQEMGVKIGDRVGICLDRGMELVVVQLGVLKAGAAYVSIDPENPWEHKEQILLDSGARVLVTTETEAVEVEGVKRAEIEAGIWAAEERENLGIKQDREALAYVMYTSDSTGRPRGVMVTHGNVVGLVRNSSFVEFRPGQTIGHVSNVACHGSTFEVWGALLNGARVAIIPKWDVLQVEELKPMVNELAITNMFLSTALLEECVRSDQGLFVGIEQVLFGGERCEEKWVKRALEEKGAGKIVHVYGLTETTTFATSYLVEKVEEGTRIPIGKPVGNTRIYILDGDFEPVGVGVLGEIYIGGAGVGRGFVSRTEMTAERFVPDPYAEGEAEDSKRTGERMYRSGDWGRWRRDGTIEFVGRNDWRVKIRGFRVELGEIEARLMEHEGVEKAVVVVKEGTQGEKRLVAYYTAAGGEATESASAEVLRVYVSAKLPEYMVPEAYVRLERMPLKPNGKLDRKALPAPESDTHAVGRYEAPIGETEALVAEIWRGVLKVERVGRQDNFFELGGRSLLAVQMIARLRQVLGVELEIRELFARPVLASLAERIIDVQLEGYDSDDLAKISTQMENS